MLANSTARLAAPTMWVLAILALLTFAPTAALAFSGGTAGRTGSGCGNCHANDANTSLAVSISGPSTLLPDETAEYTLAIAAGPAGSGGALDIALSGGGSLGIVDATTTQLDGVEIVHTDARTNNVGIFSFAFNVTAPGTVGTMLSLAAVGMQFNLPAGSGDEDIWNFAAGLPITVVPEPGTLLMTGLGLTALAAAARRRRA